MRKASGIRGPFDVADKIDRTLFVVAILLLFISVILIASSSVMESQKLYGDEFYLLKKHVLSIVAALTLAFIAGMIPSYLWEKMSFNLMIAVVVLLVSVLIFGRTVNAARRWISLGPVNLQPAELLKLCWIIYLSSFVSRKMVEVRTKLKGFFKPCIIICVMAFLLLKQPDFGSLVVVTVLAFALLWIAGSPMSYYFFCGIAGVLGLAGVIAFEPYRILRLTTFVDPWADQFGAGYQLTQSLMAFGRGGLLGQGLGNSIQKLGYLPEAHTDFVTSILGEEFGFVGMLAVIILEFVIVFKALKLGFEILRNGPKFQGFVASGIGVWFCLQTTINIAVASGAMPTKGLTLPLVSFGGSSMIVFCVATAVLLRIDFEMRRGLIDFSADDSAEEEKK